MCNPRLPKYFQREGGGEDEQRTQGFNQLIDMIHGEGWEEKALSGNKEKVSIEFPAVKYVAYNEFSMLGDEISLYETYSNTGSGVNTFWRHNKNWKPLIPTFEQKKGLWMAYIQNKKEKGLLS